MTTPAPPDRTPHRWLAPRVAAAVLCLQLAASALADDPPPKPAAPAGKASVRLGSEPIRLDTKLTPRPCRLDEAIRLALANNLDIRVEAYNPLINRQDVIAARSVFDPLFFANTGYSQSRARSETLLPAPVDPLTGSVVGSTPPPIATFSYTDVFSYDAGLRKRTLTGGTVELKYTFAKTRLRTHPFDMHSKSYRVGLELSGTQPLLRGFGQAVNTADILIAQNSRDASVYQFQTTLMRVVQDVELRYWDLLSAYENLRVTRKSLELAEDLLRITKAKVEAGDLAQIDILQSETNVALREEEIIIAENAVRNAQDALKNLVMPLNDELLTDVELLPQEPLPKASEMRDVPDLDESLKNAIGKRPELLQLRTTINSSHLQLVKAKNALLPRLDVTGRVGVSGTDGGPGRAQGDFERGETYDWGIGLAFEVPLGNRAAKASYRRAQLTRSQALVSLKRAERNIVIEVRGAHRQIQTSLKRIGAADRSVNLAQRQLDAERKKFDVGLSTIFTVNQFIEDLIRAQTNEVRAKVDYLQARARMWRADATILDEKSIRTLSQQK